MPDLCVPLLHHFSIITLSVITFRCLAFSSTHFMSVHPLSILTPFLSYSPVFLQVIIPDFQLDAGYFFQTWWNNFISNLETTKMVLQIFRAGGVSLKEIILQGKVYTNPSMFWHSYKQLKTWQSKGKHQTNLAAGSCWLHLPYIIVPFT